MFSFFSPFPFLRLCLWWVLGIVIVPEKSWDETTVAMLGLFFSISCVVFFWIKNKVIFYSVLLSLGCLVAAYIRTIEIKNRYQKPPEDVLAVRFQIMSIPQIKAKTFAFEGEISAVMNAKGQWSTIRTKSIFYVEKTVAPPQIGDVYLGMTGLQAIRAGAFPYGQNWPEYYARKGIYTTAYISAAKIKLEKRFSEFSFKGLLDKWQGYLLEHLRRVVPGERNRAVAGAMLLGSHEKIDFETKKSYAALGAIHILSVSGMHVGILFLCIQFFLKFIPKRKLISQVGIFILPILLIWFYAGITGFSAPVLRASWMFTVVLFAQTFRYPIHSINMLSFTAFIILVMDPMQLYDAGFQLSFLAVLGILIFQPLLNSIWEPSFKNRLVQYFMKQVFSLTTVAVAAQLLTFPWILYYFHQFPNVWVMLLANPLLVLLSSISLVLGMAFLLTAPIFYVLSFIKVYYLLGTLFDYSLNLLHELMLWIDSVFQPTIPFLHWEKWMFFPYFLVFILFNYWRETRSQFILCGLSLMIMGNVLYFQLVKWKTIDSQKAAYLGQYRAIPVWLGLEGLKAQIVGPISMFHDPGWIQSNISPLLAHHYIQDTVQMEWKVGKNISWNWKGKNFYLVNQIPVHSPPKIHVLIIDSRLKKGNLTWLNALRDSNRFWTQRLSAYDIAKIAQMNNSSSHQMALDTVAAQVY